MLFANDLGIESARAGLQRVNSRIDAHFGDGTVKNRLSVEVGKRRGRRGVGQVVGGNIYGLYGRNRTGLGRGNALLKVAHLGSEGGLVAYCGRHAAKKCGYLRTCLGKAENVVDEQQNVLTLVTEILCFGQAAQADAKTSSRRLIHLTVN